MTYNKPFNHKSHTRPTRSRWRGSALLVGVLMTGVMGTYFTFLKTGPQSAAAAVTVDPGTAGEKIATFLSSDPISVKATQRKVQSLQSVVASIQSNDAAGQVPLDSVKTNPFAASSSAPMTHATALRAASSLKLESTRLDGDRKLCTINQAIYTEGQTVDRFVIDRIDAQQVTLRAGGWRFALKQP